MQEENFSPQESLNLINETINKVKTSYHETGIGPILWGSVVTFCSLVSYYASVNNISWLHMVWFLTLIAVVPQIIISIKAKREKKFVSFNDVASSAIWTTFGFSMFVISIIDSLLRSHHNTGIHPAIYMLVYGIPTIITSIICNVRVMLWGGILCWLFAIASSIVNFPYPFLFMAASAIVAWLVPGLMLNIKYRKLRDKHV